MPYEVIVKIFSSIADPNDKGEYPSLLLVKSGPICSHIWSILKGTPGLWGYVDFNQPESRTFLLRCHGRPTHIWIRYGPSEVRNSWVTATLDSWLALPPSVESLEEFRFYGDPSDFDRFQWIFANPLPQFNSLTLVSGRTRYSREPEDFESWPALSQFPTSLRSITLKQVHIPWETCFTSHIINLDMDYSNVFDDRGEISMSSFVELLSLCTRLETLRLFYVGPGIEDETPAYIPSTNPAHLTNLRVFDITAHSYNIAYTMSHLQLPDTARIYICPTVNYPEQLVSSTLPEAMRISPAKGLIKWKMGERFTLSMGTTEFTYNIDPDHHEFMETFMLTFESPFVEFVGYSTCAVTTLELDFTSEFEPNRIAWFAVLDALPALQRLSCASRGIASRYFAPKFFAELGRGSNGQTHCPKLEELDLLKFELSDRIVNLILHNLTLRYKAGFPIQRILPSTSFEALDPERLRLMRLRVFGGP